MSTPGLIHYGIYFIDNYRYFLIGMANYSIAIPQNKYICIFIPIPEITLLVKTT